MTAAGFSRGRRKKRGGSRIQGEALLFISGGLFLAQAAELASRVSRRIDGRFPCHPQVMQRGGRRGETGIAYTTFGGGGVDKNETGRRQRGRAELFPHKINKKSIISLRITRLRGGGNETFTPVTGISAVSCCNIGETSGGG